MTLLAEPCSASSSEDEAPKVKQVGRKRKGASSRTEVTGVEKDQSEPADPSVQATATRKRRSYVKKDGKPVKRKTKSKKKTLVDPYHFTISRFSNCFHFCAICANISEFKCLFNAPVIYSFLSRWIKLSLLKL